jgi:molecular chaperone DnaJ
MFSRTFLKTTSNFIPSPSFSFSSSHSFRRSLATKGQADCYYKILGVKESDSADDIKLAYRQLAKQHHPDLNPKNKEQAEAKFKQISEAYEVLSDEKRRKDYDMFGTDNPGAGGGGAGGFNGGGGGFHGGRNVTVEDLFSSFFTGDQFGDDPAAAAAGVEPLNVTLQVDLQDMLYLTKKEVKYDAFASCDTCAGTGSKSKKVVKCTKCNGRGKEKVSMFHFNPPNCSQCRGNGIMKITDPCPNCKGQGRVKQEGKRFDFAVPAGVMDSDVLAIKGMGNVGLNKRGGVGDLDIRIIIRPHKYIKRLNQFDLGMVVNVPLIDSILGGTVDVTMLEGGDPLKLKVAPGTVDGTQVRIPKRGLARTQLGINGGRGDFFCEFNVQVPTNLTDRQKELLRQFQEEEEKKKQNKQQQAKV